MIDSTAVTIKDMLTVQDIERSLPEIKPHQLRYLLRTRNIEPLGMLGHARVYGPDVVSRIQKAFIGMTSTKKETA